MCESLSLQHICNNCQETFLQASLFKRHLNDGTLVISFYKYIEIKELLHTKHTDIGYYIYNILAKLSFTKFASEFQTDEKLISIAVDDTAIYGYSHTAILNNSLNTASIKPLFNKLRAQNRESYSGKSLQYRLNNPRNFKVQKFKEKNIILVDDIITTGTTLTQALHVMKKEEKEILFCLTLADAGLK